MLSLAALDSSLQVNLKCLFWKLKAANDLELTVIVPEQHRADLLNQANQYPWVLIMIALDRLLFADNVMELLELGLEGESITYFFAHSITILTNHEPPAFPTLR